MTFNEILFKEQVRKKENYWKFCNQYEGNWIFTPIKRRISQNGCGLQPHYLEHERGCECVLEVAKLDQIDRIYLRGGLNEEKVQIKSIWRENT